MLEPAPWRGTEVGPLGRSSVGGPGPGDRATGGHAESQGRDRGERGGLCVDDRLGLKENSSPERECEAR